MVVVVNVSGLAQTMDFMHGVTRQLPKTLDRDLWNVSQMLGSELRKGMQMADIVDFRGIMRKSTTPVRGRRKYEYLISLPYYAGYLDRMPDHFVKVEGKLELEAWVRQRTGMSELDFPYLFVRRRPFIQGAYDRLNQRLAPENGETLKMIRRKGK